MCFQYLNIAPCTTKTLPRVLVTKVAFWPLHPTRLCETMGAKIAVVSSLLVVNAPTAGSIHLFTSMIKFDYSFSNGWFNHLVQKNRLKLHPLNLFTWWPAQFVVFTCFYDALPTIRSASLRVHDFWDEHESRTSFQSFLTLTSRWPRPRCL